MTETAHIDEPAEPFRPLRPVEHDELVDLGAFDEDPHVELLRGRRVRPSPHAAISPGSTVG